MAPGYRNTTQSRRTNRGLADHDIFEGLPVRNWRRDIVVVAPPPAHNSLSQSSDKWDNELPWGMPKDAHLMPQHSQDLLRAARSGRIYQKRPLMEDDQEDDILMPEKPEKKEVEPKDDGFTVKTWKLVPKHLEGPEFEYLAKRRKGLRGTAIKGPAPGPTMTKMTVRKTDDQGNAYIEHVVVPEGQAVEGEVIAQTVVTDVTAAVGVEGQAQAVKRRPPPPKRKAKGPGRGRKKKAMLPPTSVPAEGSAAIGGQAVPAPKPEGVIGDDGVKQDSTATPSADNEDTEMGDGSQVPSDDEGEEGEDGSEDDDQEEGEIIDEDQEREDEEANTRAREIERERMLKANQSTEPKLPTKPAISEFSMESPGGAFLSQRISQARDMGGSPLKNTFTPRSYSPSVHNPDDEAEGDEDEEPHDGRPSHRNSPFISQPEGESSYEPQHHEEILPNTALTAVDAVAMQDDAEADGNNSFQSMLDDASPNTTEMLMDESGGSQDTVLAPPKIPDISHDVGDAIEMEEQGLDEDMKDDENFVDLLGGLEEHLNEHEAAASAHLFSASDSLPVAAEVSVRGGDEEEEEEQKVAEDIEVDRLTPAQLAAEAGSPAAEQPESAKAEEDAEIPVQARVLAGVSDETVQSANTVSAQEKEESVAVEETGDEASDSHGEKEDPEVVGTEATA